jgi:hypothetical protein
VSALAVVLVVVAIVVLLLFVGGLVTVRPRSERFGGERERHILEADRALEEARASDRGWDRVVLEAAARRAFEEGRPGFTYDRLDLVLVDDRPGVSEDRAHFLASGSDGEARVVLVRRDQGWAPERVE